MILCVCGNNKKFSECCQEIIEGRRDASTPEELMRSRYSAYAKGDGRYLVLSAIKENRYEDDAELIEQFAKSVDWLKLDVLNAIGDEVEFKAYYKDQQSVKVLHEKSVFVKEDGVWRYKDGELYASKVQRNESCPCGSGKKFKKCCAK